MTFADLMQRQIAINDAKMVKLASPFSEMACCEVVIKRRAVAPFFDHMDKPIIKRIKRIGVGQAAIFRA